MTALVAAGARPILDHIVDTAGRRRGQRHCLRRTLPQGPATTWSRQDGVLLMVASRGSGEASSSAVRRRNRENRSRASVTPSRAIAGINGSIHDRCDRSASSSCSSSTSCSALVPGAAASAHAEGGYRPSDAVDSPSASASSSPVSTYDASSVSPPPPWWVRLLNRSLESHPGCTLAAFLLVDVGSALCLYAIFLVLAVPVDADFALAYALSKSIRVPRLALDAYVVGDACTHRDIPLRFQAAVRVLMHTHQLKPSRNQVETKLRNQVETKLRSG